MPEKIRPLLSAEVIKHLAKKFILPNWHHLKNTVRFKPEIRSEKYYRDQAAFYAQFIRPGDLVFDIGANVGDKTCVFLKLGANVVAVEPQPLCVRHMGRRFRRWEGKRFFIVPQGVSDAPGRLKLSICDTANTISTFSDRWQRGRFSDAAWNRRKSIAVTTLDNLIQAHGRPRFCKIDVEGFELNVLRGLTEPIPVLSFEFTKEFIDDAEACVNRMQDLGRYVFNYETGGAFLLEKPVGADQIVTLLQNDPDPRLHGNIYAFQDMTV